MSWKFDPRFYSRSTYVFFGIEWVFIRRKFAAESDLWKAAKSTWHLFATFSTFRILLRPSTIHTTGIYHITIWIDFPLRASASLPPSVLRPALPTLRSAAARRRRSGSRRCWSTEGSRNRRRQGRPPGWSRQGEGGRGGESWKCIWILNALVQYPKNVLKINLSSSEKRYSNLEICSWPNVLFFFFAKTEL